MNRSGSLKVGRKSIEVIITVCRSNVVQVTSLEQEVGRPEDSGISSYRSITEIYHAAETAEQGKPEEPQKGEFLKILDFGHYLKHFKHFLSAQSS